VLGQVFWRVLEWPIALVLWGWSRFVRATSRVRMELPLGDAPAIYVHWHQHLPLLMPLFGERRCWLMMSAAPRMSPIARWARLLGLRLVRGASGEGGREALQRLVEIARAGGSIELAVDGPGGPAFRAKPGCADLALETGLPLIAVGYRSRGAFVVRARWDDQLMVCPFADVEVMAVPVPTTEGTTRETLLEEVQRALDRLRVGR